ncbi:DUF1707 SHOCT-like domain-containing protein [Nocardia thailandica]
MKTPSQRLRARDADRADACGLIDAALADGQLTETEHARRTERAMRAETIADLDALIDDLQVPGRLANKPVVRGRSAASSRWWIAPVAILGAGALGAVVGLLGRAVTGAVAGEDVPDLTTADGIAYYLAEYRAEFGSTTADDVTLYPGYASAVRASSTPGKADDYHYDGSFDTWRSPDNRDRDAPSFDLGAIDLRAYAALRAGAARTVGIPDGRITHVIIDFDKPLRKNPSPQIRIYVRNPQFENETGYLTFTFAGEVIEVIK